MSLSTTPAPARTDAPAATTSAPAHAAPAGTRSVRRAGIAVATGSATWAAGILTLGLDHTDGWQNVAANLTSLAFQLGLVALVTVQLRTSATGTGRVARGFLHVEHALLGLAMVSSLLAAFVPDQRETAWFLALDAFWPLSMLGMFAIGIRIAIAGRWTGPARFWPLGAESWAPVVIPVAAVLSGAATYVAAGHLLLGYTALGLVLALRPELTGARD